MTYSTVRAATAGELTYLRTAGQHSRLYLAIFKPTVIYTATLSAVPSTTDRVVEITFTGGSGTLANVLPDMTLYVGSTAGGYDLGVTRIRKAPIAGTFYIGEESDIRWNNPGTVYLTVVNEFDVWPKHINTVNDTTFYMDWDIAYTDQNNVFSPVPIMGSHRVLKLTGANISTQFDWSNSYCIGSSVTGYSVSCSTASITGGTTATPTLQFTATGWHMVVLTVTAANGKTSVGVRYVYIYSDAAPPATVFQLETCNGDYEVGGWNFTVTMQDDIDLVDVPERTLCILFAEDYYGSTNVSLGQLAGCENIICVGKIAEETVDINSEQSEITLVVQGMQYWLDKIYAFPTGVMLTTSTPTNWAEMQSPTVDKVLFRLLHWGCTATKVMDIYLTNDSRLATELISPASNLRAQIQEIAFTSIQAKCGVDKFGRMFVEVEPQVVPVASRTWPTVMTLTKDDWYDSIRMQRVFINNVGMISSSGVTITSSGTGNALFSLSPGHVFTRYGTPETLDRLLLSTQGLANQFAGLVMGWRNNPFPNNEFHLSANNRMIDMFPRQRVEWTLGTTDTPRGFSFTSSKFIPRRVEFSWGDEDGFIETAVSLEMESVEMLSTDGDIPGDGDVDVSQPPAPPAFPDFPDFPVLTGGDIPVAGQKVVIYSNRYGIMYTTNFQDASPYWRQMNGGLGQLGNGDERYKILDRVIVTPGGAVYAARLRSMSGGTWNNNNADFFLYRAPSIGGTFTLIYGRANVSGTPGFFDQYGLLALGLNRTLPDNILYVALHGPSDPATAYVYVGGNGTYTQGSNVSVGILGSGGGDQAGLSATYGNGKWIYFKENNWIEIDNSGTIIGSPHALGTLAYTIFNRQMENSRRGGTSPIMYAIGDESGSPKLIMVKTTDNMNSTSEIRSNDIVYFGMDVDPTGQYLMTRGFVANTKFKSTDGGGSWAPIPALPAGNWWFLNGGTGLKWIAAQGTSIRWTEDGGSSWWNKEGNMVADFPLTDIVFPVYIGG